MLSKYTNKKKTILGSDETVKEYSLKDRKYSFIIRICCIAVSLIIVILKLIFHK
jgi:hypothetical protein